jgi:hypothetical protein
MVVAVHGAPLTVAVKTFDEVSRIALGIMAGHSNR